MVVQFKQGLKKNLIKQSIKEITHGILDKISYVDRMSHKLSGFVTNVEYDYGNDWFEIECILSKPKSEQPLINYYITETFLKILNDDTIDEYNNITDKLLGLSFETRGGKIVCCGEFT